MPKRVTAFELMLSTRDPETPAYRWIYGALRTEILEGRLLPGSRLRAAGISHFSTGFRAARS
jgi:GntR family transcriptional regulator / MocR family aminotransferase